ncbi:fasciclin domain-containing protein [Saccharibacter floricola]|uniref:FAS1 domain-containing protein n=1 Tax=Saccharibacter floricola DSM 15669 TaxID=1123227 RepID=A0ABQ0NX00_9PROT|nr:fasciclin domain-containing protein [Saccharibacter floricola]GBQ05472.1 hypothetical protein AA15669_0475 [Saccharibacter floricola DSM 15669]
MKNGLPKGLMVGVCILGGGILTGCHKLPDRQDVSSIRPSGYMRLLPEAASVESQFVPPKDGDSPNSQSAYHVPPTVSYDDHTLDENLSGSLEQEDYYVALKEAGWQRWIQEDGPYTVLASANKAMEAYVSTWPGHWRDAGNHARLKAFIGQTILIGRWDLATIRRRARYYGGNVSVKTLSGAVVTLHPLSSSGDVLVQGPYGQTHLVGGEYLQSNGVLYMADSVLPFEP